MINQQVLQGHWNEIKGKLRTRWGQLTDDDLPQFQGEVDKLVGTIQRKTGEGREAIERYLTDLSGSASSNFSQAAENVRQFSQRTADTVQNTARQATEQLRYGYNEAERAVQSRPGETLAVCFGFGMLAGLLVGLIVRSK
jgi:uncharacterized protein YjbJ (UPF0337 family)